MALPEVPASPDDPRRESMRAAHELRLLQLRYGETVAGTERLDDRVRSHRGRLRFIAEQMAELETERRRLLSEIGGFEKALLLTRRSEIDRLRQTHAEAWSPFAIRGYRVWWLRSGRLQGAARVVWDEPHLRAVCGRRVGRDEVPHSDGNCGPPACGIYAAKHPGVLMREFSMAWDGAIGLVELSGKVVEHTAGYRALEAQVVALGLVGGGRYLVTDAEDVIESAFRDPAHALVRWGTLDRSPIEPWAAIVEYLMEREAGSWTSESNSA